MGCFGRQYLSENGIQAQLRHQPQAGKVSSCPWPAVSTGLCMWLRPCCSVKLCWAVAKLRSHTYLGTRWALLSSRHIQDCTIKGAVVSHLRSVSPSVWSATQRTADSQNFTTPLSILTLCFEIKPAHFKRPELQQLWISKHLWHHTMLSNICGGLGRLAAARAYFGFCLPV